MKQIISRGIQICLIIVAGWWILSSSIVQKIITAKSGIPEKCECENYLERNTSNDSLYFSIKDNYKEYVTKLKEDIYNDKAGPLEYFKAIAYTDSIKDTKAFRCFAYGGHDYFTVIFFINNEKDDLVRVFHEKIRSGHKFTEEISEAHQAVFPRLNDTEPIKWASVKSFLIRISKKIFWTYLLFGLLIALGSVNRIWRNPYNEALFDPRNKKDFLFGILIWPIRLQRWINGNIVIRQYGNESLRVLSEQEKKVLQKYVKSFGNFNLHNHLQKRGFCVRRSFIQAMIACIIANTVLNANIGKPFQFQQDIYLIEVRSNSPPLSFESKYTVQQIPDNVSLGIQSCACIFEIEYIFQNFLNTFVMHNFAYIVFPKKIYQEVPWNPPKNMRLV